MLSDEHILKIAEVTGIVYSPKDAIAFARRIESAVLAGAVEPVAWGGYSGVGEWIVCKNQIYPWLTEPLHPSPTPEGMVSWEPVLKDGADGVSGHYCIARYNPSGYWEFLNKGKWCSAAEVIVIPDHRKTVINAAATSGKGE